MTPGLGFLRLSIAAGALLSMWLYIGLSQQSQPAALCKWLPGTRRGSITLADGATTFQLQPSLFEAAFPHLQRYQCREEGPGPSPCQGSPRGRPLLLLAIKSHPSSGSRRAALRRTWAQARDVGGFRVQPVFLLAMASDAPQHMRLAWLERDTFGDVLLWDFAESHQNLSLKERCFLQWAHQHCPQAAYILKGDDRLFVNLQGLLEYLRRTRSASDYMHGHICYHSAVARWGQKAVPHTSYPLAHYPAFACGGGLLLPGPFVPKLRQASTCLPVFPLDDVYLGFLALAAGLPFRHDGRFRAWRPRGEELGGSRISLTIPELSLGQVERLWEELWSRGRAGGGLSRRR